MLNGQSQRPIPDELNDVARIAVDAACRVPCTLGPGLLERVCCLLSRDGIERLAL